MSAFLHHMHTIMIRHSVFKIMIMSLIFSIVSGFWCTFTQVLCAFI